MSDELVVSRLGGAIYVGKSVDQAGAPTVTMRIVRGGVHITFPMSPAQATLLGAALLQPRETESRPEGK